METLAVLVFAALAAANPCQMRTSTASEIPSTTATSKSPSDYMTISIINSYGSQMLLSFGTDWGSSVPLGNPSTAVLPVTSTTEFVFPTGWAGRIAVGPNFNSDGSKIEGSFTGPPDIDVSYVDGYSVPITCSSEGAAFTGCNIELFKQPGINCTSLVDGPLCLNSGRNLPDGPAPAFFAACIHAAYIYPNDNLANRGNLPSKAISCCIGALCPAPKLQYFIVQDPI